MKKKLLIVVGAGASIDFGLPSVADVEAILNDLASKKFPLFHEPSKGFYQYVKKVIQDYFDSNPKEGLKKDVNFEEVLFQLYSLSAHKNDVNYELASNALFSSIKLPDVNFLGKCKQGVEILHQLSSASVDSIVEEFIKRCALATSRKAPEIEKLGNFFDGLREDHELGFVTLNYDNIISQASPGLFTGFDCNDTFNHSTVLKRTEWEFLYHLHGSIHFAMNDELTSTSAHKIGWESSPACGHSVQSSGRNFQYSSEGGAFPTSTIVAGLGKTQQILRQPFRTYYSQLDGIIDQADGFLFLGYGFNDSHLNSAFAEVQVFPRPVVIIDYANDEQDCLQHRSDMWSHNLSKTLRLNLRKMGEEGQDAAPSILDLKQRDIFEVSNDADRPCAIYYNGMKKACNRAIEIRKLLGS